jgi:undecaprenyl-diphosphatase
MIQGITEFLPISSSGHLVFFQSMFGLGEPPLFFDVMLHLGTLLAVVIYFRADILKIIKGVGAKLRRRNEGQEGTKLFLWIVLGTIPTGLMGISLREWFESFFLKPKWVGWMLIITGLVLWLTRWTRREGRDIKEMRWIDSVLIGIAQGLAILPGISRAGATISTGLFLGLERELSGKFSFLLSIPAILGATLLEVRKINSIQEPWMVLIGVVVAFGMGFFSLKILMKIIRIGRLSGFSYYCSAVGFIMLLLVK